MCPILSALKAEIAVKFLDCTHTALTNIHLFHLHLTFLVPVLMVPIWIASPLRQI